MCIHTQIILWFSIIHISIIVIDGRGASVVVVDIIVTAMAIVTVVAVVAVALPSILKRLFVAAWLLRVGFHIFKFIIMCFRW